MELNKDILGEVSFHCELASVKETVAEINKDDAIDVIQDCLDKIESAIDWVCDESTEVTHLVNDLTVIPYLEYVCEAIRGEGFEVDYDRYKKTVNNVEVKIGIVVVRWVI